MVLPFGLLRLVRGSEALWTTQHGTAELVRKYQPSSLTNGSSVEDGRRFRLLAVVRALTSGWLNDRIGAKTGKWASVGDRPQSLHTCLSVGRSTYTASSEFLLLVALWIGDSRRQGISTLCV